MRDPHKRWLAYFHHPPETAGRRRTPTPLGLTTSRPSLPSRMP